MFESSALTHVGSQGVHGARKIRCAPFPETEPLWPLHTGPVARASHALKAGNEFLFDLRRPRNTSFKCSAKNPDASDKKEEADHRCPQLEYESACNGAPECIWSDNCQPKSGAVWTGLEQYQQQARVDCPKLGKDDDSGDCSGNELCEWIG